MSDAKRILELAGILNEDVTKETKIISVETYGNVTKDFLDMLSKIKDALDNKEEIRLELKINGETKKTLKIDDRNKLYELQEEK